MLLKEKYHEEELNEVSKQNFNRKLENFRA